MSKSILTNNPITIESPSVTFDVNIFKLINPPIINNANTNLVARNTVTGNFEVVDTLATAFATNLQNVGGFNTLVQTPGSASTHNIKTIRSTTGSIAITSAATNLDLNANVLLNNLPSGGSTVLSNPGSGGTFNFKTILASTGISVSDNIDNVFVGLNPMTPNEIGGVYGSQRATEDNRIGFRNSVPDGSKSNVIGSELPSTLLGESSNIISSYVNLSTANGTFSRSNIILSGDNSEINSSTNTHALCNDFAGTGIDMESSIYLGNMRNTIPTTVSACINQNLYGNTIEMGKNSWYIGSGRNALTLAPNEMHFDTGCDRLYYHDLATGSNSNVLFYDPATGLITHDSTGVLPPPSTVNIYNSNGSLTSNRTLTLGGFNLTINGIGAITIVSSAALTLDSSLGAVNLGTATATSVGVGRLGISTTLGGNLFASHLALDNTKPNYLAYDSATKQIFYNTVANIPLNNIYNTSGSLTSTRNVTVPNTTSLTFTGVGNATYNVTGFLGVNLSGLNSNYSGTNSTTLSTGASGSIFIGNSNLNTITIGTGTAISTTILGSSSVIQTTTITTPLLVDANRSNIVYFDPITSQLSKSQVVNDSGAIRFTAQTSQTITSSIEQVITAGTAGAASLTANLTLSASRNVLYSGNTRRFRITFTGNVSAAVTAQEIGVAIFINGIRQDASVNITRIPSAGNFALNTCEFVVNLSSGDLVTIGFSRSTTDTTVGFTGNLFLQTVTLNNLA